MTSQLEKYLRHRSEVAILGKFYCPYCFNWILGNLLEHINKHIRLFQIDKKYEKKD